MSNTATSIKALLDLAEQAHTALIFRHAERVWLDDIVPLCQRKGISFKCGNGTYAFATFRDGRGETIHEPDARIPQRIWDLLNLDADAQGNPLGSYMKDYPEQA